MPQLFICLYYLSFIILKVERWLALEPEVCMMRFSCIMCVSGPTNPSVCVVHSITQSSTVTDSYAKFWTISATLCRRIWNGFDEPFSLGSLSFVFLSSDCWGPEQIHRDTNPLMQGMSPCPPCRAVTSSRNEATALQFEAQVTLFRPPANLLCMYFELSKWI